jgi:hypothetical protein
MNEAIETDQAAALMAIFEEVAAGGQGLAHLTCYLVWRQESEAWRLRTEK